MHAYNEDQHSVKRRHWCWPLVVARVLVQGDIGVCVYLHVCKAITTCNRHHTLQGA